MLTDDFDYKILKHIQEKTKIRFDCFRSLMDKRINFSGEKGVKM